MLASIITPTLPARARFLDRLAGMISAQTHPEIEWLACSDPGTIGEKRNILCSQANGDVIVMMDDDDHFAPDYVARCVAQLQHCDTTGASSAYFLGQDAAWLYEYTGSQPYCMGSGMAFHRRVWERSPFRCVNEGEDGMFCANAGRVVPHGYLNGFVASIHGGNTASHKQLHRMRSVDVGVVRRECPFVQ